MPSQPNSNEALAHTLRLSEEFLGGDTTAGLERLRNRLLDLTGRNRLLHFRHARGSCFRIVDKLPDVVFQRLLDGQRLSFKPVPEPSSPDYGPNRTKPAAETFAAKLGIATSFDLPDSHALSITKTSHHDQSLQTLHYAPDLNTLARRIANAARTSIEESGTNMLYLAFGFLEWQEEQDGAQSRHAPLLMVPVSITRERSSEGGAIRNCLEYTGEDLAANLCLAEMLRQDFSLVLPTPFEEETPESYFSRVQKAIAHQRGWKVRRWATVCLLYFGKLLMYLDLDPKRWPRGKEIHKHPRIRDLFEGVKSESPAVAEDYLIDTAATARDLPPLVYDADSSQHSALIDIFRGRNVVVQGPPGTGKSQTITNLIAGALSKGKTVLFVSEKLAALEVVRRRLDEAGLGVFCLELHSHKTQKQQLLKELEERLRRKGAFQDPAGIDHKLQALDQNKQELLNYVDIINSRFGSLGQTIFEILWARHRLRDALPFNPDIADGILLVNVDSLTAAQVEGHRQALDIFSGHLSRVLRRHASLSEHPWYGVRNSGLDYFGEEALFHTLQAYLRKCQELQETLAACGALFSLEVTDSVAKIELARSVKRALPTTQGFPLLAVLPHLADEENRQLLRRFLSDIGLFGSDEVNLHNILGDWTRFDSALQGTLIATVRRAEELGVLDWDGRKVSDWVIRLEEYRAAIDEVTSLLQDTFDLLEGELHCTMQDLGSLVAGLDLLRSNTPLHLLPLRNRNFEQETATATVRSAAEEALRLRGVREPLQAEFRLQDITSLDELRGHMAVLESAGRWRRWFGGSYRRSGRFFRRLSKSARRARHDEMVRALRDVLAFCERKEAFRGHSCWSFIGSSEGGVDAAWDDLLRVVEWYEDVYTRLPRRTGFSGGLAQSLFSTRSEALREIVRLVNSRPTLFSQLRAVAADVVNIVSALPPESALSIEMAPAAFVQRLKLIVRDLRLIQDSLANAHMPDGIRIGDIPALLERCKALELRRASLQAAPSVREILGQHFAGVETDGAAVTAVLEIAEALAASDLPPRLKAWLFEGGDAARFAAALGWCEELVRHLDELTALWAEFIDHAALESSRWFRLPEGSPQPGLDLLRRRAEEALGSRSELSEWTEYLRAKAEVHRKKLDGIALLAQRRMAEPAHLIQAFNYVLFNSLARRALESQPRLMHFSGLSHEQVRRDFVRLDEEVIEQYRLRIAHLIDGRPVPAGVHTGPVSQWTELALLYREMEKKSKHIPIRQLVCRATNALLALKPCFMMGPLSVAQYLPAGAIEFDLVVMDEASQLKPEDAIGAIARGRQVVIVGDREQLPPTTFFERSVTEDEASDLDITAAEDAGSILDVAASVYQPLRRLRWHYRSRHHSLIAFSNKEFYDGDLIVFPAAFASAPDLGVRYVSIENGVYEGRRNVLEARQIVDAVCAHMSQHPSESLGVATMNFEQCELLDEMLDKELQNDPYARRFIDKWKREAEPFFVKNLENVQGDERDVIFISMTYGRDARGNFYQRFGPINGPVGYRRLNVLFTRAKKRTVVFSSMDPGSVHVDSGSAPGVRVLKNYLEYAKSRVLQVPEGSAGGPESDFEISVAQTLRAHGYEGVPQVGVAGFFVDIAVRHPQKSGAYLLGIECDGAAYHSARSARDRDRLRQMILENLGWRIHRIWSTDWYKFKQRETEKLLTRIDELLRSEEREEALRRAALLEAHRGRHGRVGLEPEEAADIQAAVKDELRAQLLALKDAMQKECPDVPAARRLLRGEMLEKLLQKRPTSKNEWLNLIPYELRSATDLVEIRKFLPRILEIFAEATE